MKQRIIPIIATFAAALGWLLSCAIIKGGAQFARVQYEELLGGRPLPAITAQVISLVHYPAMPLLAGAGGALVIVIAAYALVRTAPTGETALHRLLGFTTAIWTLVFLAIFFSFLSLMLPMIGGTITRMSDN